MTRSAGMLVLAIYLIVIGLAGLVHVAIPLALTALIALLAGVLILVGRWAALSRDAVRTPSRSNRQTLATVH
jgi:hypothetical protein